MKITMKEAILQGKDFKFWYDSDLFESKDDDFFVNAIPTSLTPFFVIENQNILVEVEDNYWDEDGRAIKELGKEQRYYSILNEADIVDACWNDCISDMGRFSIGNCFKDKESAEAELQRLQYKQKERMENNGR